MIDPDNVLSKEEWSSIRECKECTRLELDFGVSHEQDYLGAKEFSRTPWVVYDAECEIVCHCDTEAKALAIVRGLKSISRHYDLYIWCAKHLPNGQRFEATMRAQDDE